MIADLRSLDNGTDIECDVCIIGAGAAGITIARQFIGRPHSVVLLESGGLEFEPETQALYEFENIGLPRDRDTRFRYFGGTTNAWDGRCAPLTDHVLTRRPWLDNSGWPLSVDDLKAYYAAAHAVCGLRLQMDGAQFAAMLGDRIPTLDASKLVHQFWQYRPKQPMRFGIKYRSDLATASNVRVLLHANVTNIQVSSNASTVEHVEARTMAGQQAQVRARVVVLCCGGIENARLLLLSCGVEPNGLGNRRDLVGRFFMEHPRSGCAEVLARDPYWFRTTYSGYWPPNSGKILPGLALSADAQAREQLLDCGAMFYYEDEPESGTLALERLLDKDRRETTADAMAQDVWRVMANLDEVTVNLRRKVLVPDKEAYVRPSRITMTCDVEQAPNPDSRVTLSRECDALGLHRACIDWRITELERRTVQAFAMAVGEEFGRLNIGRLRLSEWVTNLRAPASFREVHHHMGTTRMAATPETGVVSPDCQVFGVANLYVAGSSVFPASGFVNPTLTIVALSLRLADHLMSRL